MKMNKHYNELKASYLFWGHCSINEKRIRE